MSAGNHAGPSGRKYSTSSMNASTLWPDSELSPTMASQLASLSAASACACSWSFVTRSDFDSTQIFFACLQCGPSSWAATHSSPRPTGLEASMSMAMTSTSSSALSAEVFSSSPSASCGLCRPGVSTMIICMSSRVYTARKRWRVVCAVFLCPTTALIRVDLPAFGRPISVTKPDLKPSPEGGAACPK